MASLPERDYNHMVAQLHHQQRYIAALEAENRDLRRQLAELRRGVGVTVTIQGQTMSLTAPVATVVAQSTEPADPSITGIVPIMPAPAPQRAWGHPAPAAPVNPAGAGEYSEQSDEYGENAWLTGPMRRVSPISRSRQQQPPPAEPRPLTPSQQVTPLWLREEPPEWPSLTPQTTQATPPRRTPPISRPLMPQPQQPQPQQPQHAHLRYQQPEQFDSLARLTGHHPVVRPNTPNIPHQQQPSNGRNPYTDSFVLG